MSSIDRLGHDLALIADQHVDAGEATPEARLASAEQDARPVVEEDLLVTLAAQHLQDVGGHLRPLRHAVELRERLLRRRLAVRRPDHRQVPGFSQAQREDDARDQVRLADLARDADLDRVGGVRAIRPLRQDQRPAPSCQPSKPQPSRRQVSRTLGQPVVADALGAMT
jgi:hypothetical protein